MICNIASAVVIGVEAFPILVEVAVYPGLPGFSLVGLPDTSIREARERVFTALRSSEFKVPNQRMVVNLSPAFLRKEGTQLDLPIALGILAASGQIPLHLFQNVICVGELSLQGELKGVHGFLAIDECGKKMGARGLCCPAIHKDEGSFSYATPKCYLHHLREMNTWGNKETLEFIEESDVTVPISTPFHLDYADVKGQEWAKKIMMVAAIGGHSVLLAGSPGCGKTMLAERFTGLLPKLTREQALEVSKIHRINKCQESSAPLHIYPPFRAPHHSISRASLIGGGRVPIPGEVTLAHHGVLFLDELTEFDRTGLEALRQPLESKKVEISRLGYQVAFPANFQLFVAFNPCPCGFFLDRGRGCKCSPSIILKYISKISGPLLDRIDLQCELCTDWENVKPDLESDVGEREARLGFSTQAMRQKVEVAQSFRSERENRLKAKEELPKEGTKKGLSLNLEQTCFGESTHKKAFQQLIRRERVSFRVANKLLKIARSLADFEQRWWVIEDDVLEALEMRALDRTLRDHFRIPVQ